MIDLSKIVEKCKTYDKKAQKELYDVYSPVLFGVCLRYSSSHTDAEDILQEGFVKVFTKINNFSGKGSFEGWMRRVVVNTAISHYHKNKKHKEVYDIDEIQETDIEGSNFDTVDFTKEELFSVINRLPEGSRIVFNMYAIEGFRHKEIAKKLNISENTSKSQYSRARDKIKKMLETISKYKIENDK